MTENAVAELLAAILPSIQAFADQENASLEALGSNIQEIGDISTQVAGAVVSGMQNLGDTIVEKYDLLSSDITKGLGALNAEFSTIIGESLELIVGHISVATLAYSDAVATTQERLIELMGQGQLQSLNTLESFQSTIASFLGTFTERLIDPFKEFAVAVDAQAEALERIADILLGIKEGKDGSIFDGLPGLLIPAIGRAIFGGEKERAHDTEGNLAKMMSIVKNPAIKGAEPNIMFEGSVPIAPILRSIMTVITLPFMFMQYMGAYQTPEIEKTRQASNIRNPWQKLPLEQLSVALRRGFIGTDKLIEDLGAQGYSNEDVGVVQQLIEQIIPPLDLIDWMRRGIIGEGESQTRMFNQGFKAEDIENITEASFHLPGVADLIEMSVKEVFSPEVSQAFGQHLEYPPELTKWGRKIGIKEEVLRLYWMAHWKLPSVNMGFDMLHRGIIDNTRLDKLFIALDIMPGWRDELKQLSYRVPTRVDTRRFHALGLIDREQVKSLYLRRGYSPEDAELQTKFTEVYNDQVSTIGEDKARELSMAQTLGLFEDGLLSGAEAEVILQSTGFSPDDSALLVLSRELDVERKARKRQLALVKNRVVKRIIDINQGAARLANLGMSPGEIKEAVAEMEFALEEGVNTPPLSDLVKMKGKGIINNDEFESGLYALGFGPEWSARYLKLYK